MQPKDERCQSVKPARITILCVLAAALNLSVPHAAQAETEAEAAAKSERRPTQAEIKRLQKQCPLPETGEPAPGFPADLNATKVHLPAQRYVFLVTISEKPGTNGQKTVVSRWPDLPRGGIGSRDYCGSMTLEVVPDADEVAKAIFGWRLRPQLDLQKDYPTAFGTLTQGNQYLLVGSGDYMFIRLERADQSTGVMERLKGNSEVPPGTPYFTMGNGLYIQLSESQI